MMIHYLIKLKKKKKNTLFFWSYGPLKFGHFKIVSKISQSIWARGLKLGQLIGDNMCEQDISETIWAKGLELGQLIGDDE